MRDEQDKQQERSDGELGDHSDRRQQNSTHGITDVFCVFFTQLRNALKHITQEHRQQEANNQPAKNSNVLKHFTHFQAFLGGFRFGETLTEEHQSIDGRGDQIKRKLNFPVKFHPVVQHPAQDSTDDQPGRPACVKDIQVVSSLVREQCCHQRVGDCFQTSVRQSEKKHPPEQTVVSVLGR